VFDRVTIDSSVTDYDVRYPLISSNRVWQFSGSTRFQTQTFQVGTTIVQTIVTNINHASGEIVYTELFPAVRVASIFDLIESKYQITFNGIFLASDLFRKAFLFYKNKESYHYTNNPVELDFTSSRRRFSKCV
jgi:hypothetical protein